LLNVLAIILFLLFPSALIARILVLFQ